MALTPEDKAYIADLVQNTPSCACGLKKEAQMGMGHIVGVIRDEGDGDYDKGAERLRDTMRLSRTIDMDAMKSVLKLLRRIDTASIWITRAVLTFAVLWLLKIFGNWTGVGIIETIKKMSP